MDDAATDSTLSVIVEVTGSGAGPGVNTVAPSESITLTARVRGTGPPANARLRFILPPHIRIVADAVESVEVALLEHSREATVMRQVTVHPAAADGSWLRFEAVVDLPDGRLVRSNRVARRVRGQAHLDGPGTCIGIERTATAGDFRVFARIANDGNAPAHGVTIDLDVPGGTQLRDPESGTSTTFDRINPGETRTFSYLVSLRASNWRRLRIEAARIGLVDGRVVCLPPSEAFALASQIAPPAIAITRDGRRVHVRIQGRNIGPGTAEDVHLTVRWPAGFCVHPQSLAWNGARVAGADRTTAVARAIVNPTSVDVVVASIGAGQTYDLGLELDAGVLACAGTLDVSFHENGSAFTAQAQLDWESQTDIRLRILDLTNTGQPPGAFGVAIELINAGGDDAVVSLELDHESDCDVQPRIDDQSVTLISLAAGDCYCAQIGIVARTGSVAETNTSRLIARSLGKIVASTPLTLQLSARDFVALRLPRPDPLCAAASRDSFDDHMSERSDRVALTVGLDQERIADCLRRLRQPIGGDVSSHLSAVASLFADTSGSGDREVSAALATLRSALVEAFDRQAVRRRLASLDGGYGNRDDRAVGSAMTDLLDVIRCASSGRRTAIDSPNSFEVTPANVVIGEAFFDCISAPSSDAFCEEAIGTTKVLRAIVTLLPTRIPAEAPLQDAVQAYTACLRAILSEYPAGPSLAVALELDVARGNLSKALTEVHRRLKSAGEARSHESSTTPYALAGIE